ncbi:MAG: gliding motility lipoprotein GldH [Flavobacteriaceae bacterium]|nr:gliding motility lipoprotein GldH [Flavobacteriaceae bacterium]
MKTNSIGLLLFIAVFLGFTSCDSKRVYDTYKTLDNQSWNLDKKVQFSFNINDTLTKNNLFINVRNNNKYNFNNLFLITELNFPNGKKIVDTLEYQMADNSGKFLGNGFTEIKESKLFYKEHVVFPISGVYTLAISQAMRKNNQIDGIQNLEGITEVGFRIEKN